MATSLQLNSTSRLRGNGANSSPAGKHYHLIGIGGCGMSGASRLLRELGAVVSGSDSTATPVTLRLIEERFDVCIGHSAAALPANVDVVVHSAAIPETNEELLEARRRGCEVISYAALLGRLMTERVGVAVAGTHGKSTTSAMVSYTLRQAGLDPSFVIGAKVPQLGGIGAAVGRGPHFVVEACEYHRSFLSLQPAVATLLNIEEDHLDCYADLDEIIEAFAEFAAGVRPGGAVVASIDDRNVRTALRAALPSSIRWFGMQSTDAHWRADAMELRNGCYAFDLMHRGASIGRVQLSAPGRHNVANALAAAAVAHECGCNNDAIIASLSSYAGAGRRLTLRAERNGVSVIDDYAHHPTEVRASLAAVRERYQPARLIGVFQPHQYSRTLAMLDEFARSFDAADMVVIPDIYSVRDNEEDLRRVHATDLVSRLASNGRTAAYLPEFDRIAAFLVEEARAGDVIVTMGAGDVWKVADAVAHRLGANH